MSGQPPSRRTSRRDSTGVSGGLSAHTQATGNMVNRARSNNVPSGHNDSARPTDLSSSRAVQPLTTSATERRSGPSNEVPASQPLRHASAVRSVADQTQRPRMIAGRRAGVHPAASTSATTSAAPRAGANMSRPSPSTSNQEGSSARRHRGIGRLASTSDGSLSDAHSRASQVATAQHWASNPREAAAPPQRTPFAVPPQPDARTDSSLEETLLQHVLEASRAEFASSGSREDRDLERAMAASRMDARLIEGMAGVSEEQQLQRAMAASRLEAASRFPPAYIDEDRVQEALASSAMEFEQSQSSRFQNERDAALRMSEQDYETSLQQSLAAQERAVEQSRRQWEREQQSTHEAEVHAALEQSRALDRRHREQEEARRFEATRNASLMNAELAQRARFEAELASVTQLSMREAGIVQSPRAPQMDPAERARQARAEALEAETRRLLREQQDAEYEASIKMDRAKEQARLHAAQEAENKQRMIAEARAAALRAIDEQKNADQKKADDEVARRTTQLNNLQDLASRLQQILPLEPEPAESGICELMFDVQHTGQRLRRRFRLSDPVSAVYTFVKWSIAKDGSVDDTSGPHAGGDAHAELMQKGFGLVQAFGRPDPLPMDSRSPLSDLDIARRDKFIAKLL
eukprot:CAMPEP_0114312996 /NCGR_PEP_ID=MMETSP0059-20121206/20822_1 /TAXON_ID=36894 /ORGANISM="Pyramimonas parkeae, Strain CCMP726" /LENGTH=636 /DNA_ID=CAMNT_0001437607 /DNA_START=61 /DNA_END=1970 /DNA_ORIENTATION=+